jgi:hypothetical protein
MAACHKEWSRDHPKMLMKEFIDIDKKLFLNIE